MDTNTKILLGVGGAAAVGGLIWFVTSRGKKEESQTTNGQISSQRKANDIAVVEAAAPSLNLEAPIFKVYSIKFKGWGADTVEYEVDYEFNKGWTLDAAVDVSGGADINTYSGWKGWCWDWKSCKANVDLVYNVDPIVLEQGYTSEQLKQDKKRRTMTVSIPLCMDKCSNDDTYGLNVVFRLEGSLLDVPNGSSWVAYGEESYDHDFCQVGFTPLAYNQAICS